MYGDVFRNTDVWEDWELYELNSSGEYYSAGFLAGGKERPVITRTAYGINNYLANTQLPEYKGTRLYPSGNVRLWMPFYVVNESYSWSSAAAVIRVEELKKKGGLSAPRIQVLDKYLDFLHSYPEFFEYCIWCHSIPNYGRFLREGLPGYKDRIGSSLLKYKASNDKLEFLEALNITLDGVCLLVRRIMAYLENMALENGSWEPNLKTLIDSYKAMLEGPACSFETAMTAANFLYYLDGCDNIGRFDQFMLPYYEQGRRDGLSNEAALEWIKELWKNVDTTSGYNVTIGGSRRDGLPAYNELSLLALRAAKGMRHPNITLRLRFDTSEEIWDEALDVLSSGTGIPALYSEENYIKALEEARVGIVGDDIFDYTFGGCTETMIQGCSNVGSTDALVNILKILEDTLYSKLENCETFGQLMDAYKENLKCEISKTAQNVNNDWERIACLYPQPVRSIFIDDCIDTAREFNRGGARYNWTTIGICGLNNVIDSLYAIRDMVFDRREVTAADLLSALRSDFKDDPLLQMKLLALPKFGNDIEEVDELANEISGFVFRELTGHAYWKGGRLLAGIINFLVYDICGSDIGATPDGRRAHTPLGDSAGPVQGRDRKGPTAMLRSVTRLDLVHAPQTPVVNIRFSKKTFSQPESRERLKALFKTYFKAGGMQIQVNVVDQAVLKDAVEHPELHDSLVVRIGGFSTYFNQLSHDLKLSVLERTEHDV